MMITALEYHLSIQCMSYTDLHSKSFFEHDDLLLLSYLYKYKHTDTTNDINPTSNQYRIVYFRTCAKDNSHNILFFVARRFLKSKRLRC